MRGVNWRTQSASGRIKAEGSSAHPDWITKWKTSASGSASSMMLSLLVGISGSHSSINSIKMKISTRVCANLIHMPIVITEGVATPGGA